VVRANHRFKLVRAGLSSASLLHLRLVFGALIVLTSLAACSADDDEGVPVEEIPGDKLLVDLTADEFTGLCDWAAELSHETFTDEVHCEGTRVQFHGCMRVSERCTATVEQWRDCIPDMIDHFAEYPCEALEVRSSEDFAAFIEEVPTCEGLGHCANTID
jgi:hypothetical protein